MKKVIKAVLPKKGTIDRFEGDFALVEMETEIEAETEVETELNIIQVPINNLPKGSKEGDILIQDEAFNWHLQQTETDERRRSIENLMDSLFEEK